MSAVWALARREMQAYFVSPIAYAFMAVFLAIVGVGFYGVTRAYVAIPAAVMEQNGWTIRTFLIGGTGRGGGLVTWAHIAMLVSVPGLAMRLLSEERKSGTAELLFTSPLTTWQLVLGKYLGALSVFAMILVLTLPMPAFLGWKAQPEWGALAAAYLGLLLHGAFLLAIGLFTSSLTENQFVGLVLTYAVIVPFYLAEMAVGLLGSPLDEIVAAAAATGGLNRTARGLIDSHDVGLWVLLTFAFLFLSGRVLDSGRWR